ncbi:cupin domain-containing protein [Micrococcus sp. EYE_162]|uniref:cupin domain-containing protein n=1 Tax=unclassified Micrococcus TaxID=2620948 RepID=UPI002003FBA7|nr:MULTISPECIES: cupin domain-containing protein [unclassified Micrococcus]MCK6095873.1 cupin domain-containing protein [Micrococcus sp. EYE_212]MCK6171964.1 cupin domain-containing protein [Micrococcus sp. EYE_162]
MDETNAPTPEAPRVLADVAALMDGLAAAEPGAAWRLEDDPRDLDVNLVRLPAGGRNEPFEGPGLDILVHVVAGSGVLHTDGGDVPIRAGQLLWLPKSSRRGFTAGDEGLAWLTAHRRKQGLAIGHRPG